MVQLFLGYIVMSFAGVRSCILCSKAYLKSVGIKAFYYPKKYVDLPPFLRKFYRVPCKKVAKFIYVEMLMPFVYLAELPINIITIFLLEPKALVLQIQFLVWSAIVFAEKSYVIVTDLLWKRKK